MAVDDFPRDVPRDPAHFLWVHRLVPYKRPLEVAEAFRELPELRLTMVGVGPLEDAAARDACRRTSSCSAGSRASGWRELFAGAGGFIHVGEEDFGISMVEALAAGAPVLGRRRRRRARHRAPRARRDADRRSRPTRASIRAGVRELARRELGRGRAAARARSASRRSGSARASPRSCARTARADPVSTGSAARVGRGTAVNWVAWILARALALATLLMLARSLGVDELGALLSALAAGVLGAALATGGLADATARQAAAAGQAPRPEFGRGDLLRGIRRFGAVLPLVLAVVIVITARSSDDFGASELIASSLLAITQGAITISAAVFRARNQPARFALATNLASSVGRAVIASARTGW